MTDQQLNASGESPTNACAAFLAEHDADCPNCGYNLRGVKSGTCPECAHAITFGAIVKRYRVYRRWLTPVLAGSLLLALVPQLGYLSNRGEAVYPPGGSPTLSATLMLAYAVPLVAPALFWVSNRRRLWIRWRGGAPIVAWSAATLIAACVATATSLDPLLSFVTLSFIRELDRLQDVLRHLVGLVILATVLTCYVAMCVASTPAMLATWTRRTIIALIACTLLERMWTLLWFFFI